MELLQLKYFCDASETQNFSKTAQKYRVPTSNISQTIRRLEKELGVDLFDRAANKIKLNEAGKSFYEGAKKALATLDEAKEKISVSGPIKGEIKILISTNRRTVNKAIEKFRMKYNEVTFLISHGLSDEVRNYDIIISDNDTGYKNYQKKLLISEKLLLAVSNSQPISKMKSIDISMLRDEKFIMMNSHTSLNNITHKLCREAGFAPNIVISCDDPFYVREYVDMGLGVSIIPSFSWEGLFSQGVSCIDINGKKRESYVFYSNYLTTASQLFLDELINTFDEYSNK